MNEPASPTAAGGADEVAVRPATDADEPAILQLLTTALGGGPTGRRTPEFFRWKHHANPFGASLALVAEAGDQLVGFRTLMRWRFRAGHHRVSAVRAVDTATHPDWQGRGVFSRLTAAAREQLRGDTDLIFNTPNARSLPGYRKLGWAEVGQVPIRLRPVRWGRLAARARAARRSEAGMPLTGPDWSSLSQALADRRAVAALLADADAGDGRLATDHDVDTLAWRYASCPDLDYRALTLPTPGGELAGLAIGRRRRRGPLAELTLAEVIVRRGDRRTARRLLSTAARADADHITAHLPAGSPALEVARRCGYVTVPGQGPTLVAHPLGPVTPDPVAWDSWRLSLGDLEVF